MSANLRVASSSRPDSSPTCHRLINSSGNFLEKPCHAGLPFSVLSAAERSLPAMMEFGTRSAAFFVACVIGSPAL